MFKSWPSRERGSAVPNLLPTFFFLIFLVIGLLALSFAWKQRSKLGEIEHWPTAEGIVKTAEITESRGSKSTTYGASVTYDFTVDSNDYIGRKVTWDEMLSSDRSYASSIVAQYPPGKPVKVYYNPDDPNEAVLRNGSGGGSWIVLLCGVVFTAVGALGVVGTLLRLGKG